MRVRWALLLGVLLCATGCHAGKVFIASPGDYADYRRVRVAETADERLALAWEYLKSRPDGTYAERLRRYFDRAEPVFFRVRSRSAKGLEAYLRSLPDGPHAAEALTRLVELRTERRREELDSRVARQTGQRLDRERSQRAASAEILGWWLSRLLDGALWQAPLAQAPGDFLVRYRLALPAPICEPAEDEGERCLKLVARSFRVRGEGRKLAREVAFDLELGLDARGRLRGVTLMGSAIFLRTLEAERQEALDDEQTAEAVSLFVAWLGAHLAERDVACSGGSEPDGTIVLDCDRLRLTLSPGQGGGDDMVLIAPIPSEPEPAAPLPSEAPAPAEPAASEGEPDGEADEGPPYD